MRQALHPTHDTLADGADAALGLLAALRRCGTRFRARVAARRLRIATRRGVAELSPSLRADIGLPDKDPTYGSGPILAMEGTTMRYLMSLR